MSSYNVGFSASFNYNTMGASAISNHVRGSNTNISEAGKLKNRVGFTVTPPEYYVAATKDSGNIGFFEMIYLIFTHTKVLIGQDYYYLNNNSVKNRLGNKALEDLKSHSKANSNAIKILYDAQKNAGVILHGAAVEMFEKRRLLR